MQIKEKEKIEEYYQALVNRDPTYVGTFYVGVKTTGIFCKSTCRARKPKLENVVFFNSPKELLQNGYRPCKVCKPTETHPAIDAEIKKAFHLLEENPLEKITAYRLSQKGLHPDRINRWFKKNYDLSFAAYQRMLRINHAYQSLQNGSKVTDSAYQSGYDSLSGFGYTFKTLTGKAPSHATERQVIYLTKMHTPLGPMFAGADDQGICLFEFTDRRMLETEFRDLQKRLNAIIILGENDHLKKLKGEVDQYFQGQLQRFTVPLHAPGTEFQQEVWLQLQAIPYGTTRSYQKQAEVLGKPQAVRAVANANGANRIAILIPCHRVIGKDGNLTGYGGGLERKKWLLDHERKFL